MDDNPFFILESFYKGWAMLIEIIVFTLWE